MKRLLHLFLIPCFTVFTLNTAFAPSAEGRFLAGEKEASQQQLYKISATLERLIQFSHQQDQDAALRSFHQARRQYKHFEYLFEYFHHSSIVKHINGAPLPKIEEKVADLTVLPPKGFQRLEEVLYEEEPNWNAAVKLSRAMIEQLHPITKYHQRLQLYDRHVLEAVRYELIHLYTLGLTGFENPASDSALAETLYAFKSLEVPTRHYAAQVSAELAQGAAQLFYQGKKMLQAGSFDSFDRLTFLKEVNDPLFTLVLEIHTTLGIETYEEVNTAPVATQYEATSLFDINLLNKDYFLKYPTETIQEEQVSLGRTLFFDPALSYNNSLSCSSCHHPDKAFTDGLPKSLGNDMESEVARNAPTLVNAIYSGAFFHDLRAGKLAMQTEHVMVSPDEFNVRPLELADKLEKSVEYIALFEAAFPGLKDPIQPRTIKSSLAAYVATLTSWDSEFDQYVRGEREEISASIKNGYNLFMGKATCGTCHFAPNFSGIVPPFYDDTESEVLGVPATNDTIDPVLDADLGRYENGVRAERAEHFKNSFKTPTVRNIELTGPYFHNGSYPTLEEVMWFYNKGGGQGIGLDVPNQTLPPDELGLTKKEIADVIAFMESLTDIKGFQERPEQLPAFPTIPDLQNRTVMAY